MKVFLSYAAEDRDFANRIAAALREQGHDVYPSANWPQEVQAAVNRADAFVVLLSPDAVGSPFVTEEIRQALVAERLENRVIPVILNPSTRLPWILQTMEPISTKRNPRIAAEMINKRLHRENAADPSTR